MKRYAALVICGLLAGCHSPKRSAIPQAYTITDELIITVDEEASEDQLTFNLRHHTMVQEKGESESHGKKNDFSIQLAPSVWARVKRSGTVLGYLSETECLLDGEMVEVSGMPGENFTVKIEPLAMERYRVIGIYLAARFSEYGEQEKTISFDFVAEAGTETTVYRKTVVFDPEARLGEEMLLRN